MRSPCGATSTVTTSARSQLGSGATRLDGWLHTDLEPKRPNIIRLDATKQFPFPDESLDFIAAEHVIEHMGYPHGQKLLRQCWRTLRPGGVVRIATPHLRRLAEMYLGQAGPEGSCSRRGPSSATTRAGATPTATRPPS